MSDTITDYTTRRLSKRQSIQVCPKCGQNGKLEVHHLPRGDAYLMLHKTELVGGISRHMIEHCWLSIQQQEAST